MDDLILKKEKLAKLQQEKSDSEKKRIEMIRELQKDKESNQLKLVREQGAKESNENRILKDINNKAHQLADKYK